MRRAWRVGMLVVVSWGTVLSGAVQLRMPSHYVEDQANVIAANHEKSLNGLLQELEQKTGIQYIVLTLHSLQGEPIESLGLRLAHTEWKLGQAEKDNGLLFILAVQDKRYRFEVGYGLEGTVPDAFVGRIGSNVLAPAMRANQPSEGVYQANLQVVQQLAQAAGIQLTGMPTLKTVPVQSRRSRRTLPFCGLLPMLILFMIFFGGGGRGRGGGGWLIWPLLLGGMGRHRHHGGFGGFGGGFGGFGGGGGGFGGFGGGGGGGFGGGGASGGW